jgi:hypothetical protein
MARKEERNVTNETERERERERDESESITTG